MAIVMRMSKTIKRLKTEIVEFEIRKAMYDKDTKFGIEKRAKLDALIADRKEVIEHREAS